MNAGLLANFPELAQAQWLQNALVMEKELNMIRRLHREYQEGVKYKSLGIIGAEVIITPDVMNAPSGTVAEADKINDVAAVESIKKKKIVIVDKRKIANELPIENRVKTVHKFAKLLVKLDVEQNYDTFKSDLININQKYYERVEPILLRNIEYERNDSAGN